MDKVLFILIGSIVFGGLLLLGEWFSGWMHGKPLFAVPSSRVGIGALVARLEAVGVKRK